MLGRENEKINYINEFMAQFIAMAQSLMQWDQTYGSGGNLGWDYYYAMAFSGQFTVDEYGNITSETDTFKALIPDSSTRKAIVDIVLNEQKGNSNSKGEKCP